jgi:hypothetical protein
VEVQAMSGVLIINDEARKQIAQAIEKARARPTPWVAPLAVATDTPTLTLAERPKGTSQLRQEYPSQHLMLGTYHAAISFEHQPAGLFRHMSVSSRMRGKVPGLEVIQMLVEEFGFSGWPLQRPGRVWMEEFEFKRHAVNVIELEKLAAL